ncbi:MAG: hypothetical protein JO170_22090 [Verrucomicrobia bacterium]|nr:hypothetical protein [Verrucomicrobiota bacterium]
MEFVDGETLENLIRCGDPLEIELALEILADVAAGDWQLIHYGIESLKR